jgi:phage/plasmid-associated DNA primase
MTDKEKFDRFSVVATLTDQHPEYCFYNTGQEDGYWIKCTDRLGSYFITDVELELKDTIMDTLISMGYSSRAQTPDEINKILAIFKVQRYLTHADFRIDRDLIHFQNGIYIITWKVFLPRDTANTEYPDYMPSPDWYLAHQWRTFNIIPHDYKPNVETDDEFDDFLKLIFNDTTIGGKKITGKQQQQMWWEWMGYCLTDRLIRTAAIHRGPRGTGKSTLGFVKLRVLGEDNYSLESLHNICHDKESTAAMYRKKFNYDDDVGTSLIKNYEQFKKATGLERMRIRPLFQNSFTGDATAKMAIGANNLPPVKNIGTDFTCRWIIFFYNHFFCKKDPTANEIARWKANGITSWTIRDENFRDKGFTKESTYEYIIVRAINALHDIINRGYFEGMSEDDVLEYWLLETDAVYKFISQVCSTNVTRAESEIQSTLYNKFVEYCDTTGTRTWIKAQRQFTEVMANFGYPVKDGGKRDVYDPETATTKQNTHVKVYHGITINDDKWEDILNEETIHNQPTKHPWQLKPASGTLDKYRSR